MKLIRDPVHGYVEVRDRLLPIVSHPYFQRLRYIAQTGLAYLVYPGMTHSRFEHSLGTMHLAMDFVKYIGQNSGVDFASQDYAELVSLVGLLHDIGHLPFSHTYENALETYERVFGGKVEHRGRKTHVDVGIRVVQEVFADIIDKAFSGVVSDPVKFVVDVMREEPKSEEERLANLIVSNFIDADRGDYLLRDSYHAGVEYGLYDIERLKRFMIFVDGKLAVMRKAVPIVEHFLLARMYMYENVYFHSVVGMYNAVLATGIAKMFVNRDLDPIPEVKDLLEYVDFHVLGMIRDVKPFGEGVIYRQGWKRYKRDIEGGCLDAVRERASEISRETGGLVILHEFRDAPYKESKSDAVFVYDETVYELSRVSEVAKALSEIRKGVIVYHTSAEDKAKELIKQAEECKT